MLTRHALRRVRSVGHRLLDAVDHPDLDRPLGRIELEPELFLNRGEEVRGVGIDWRRRGPGRQLTRRHLGLELDLELPVAGQPRAIDDGATDASGNAVGEERQRIVPESDSAGSLLDAADDRRRTTI